MQHFVHSEPGHAHTNEDAVEVHWLPADDRMLLCALADGQGGQSGGAAAAQIAVRKSLEVALTFTPVDLLNERIWRGIVNAADEGVAEAPSAGYTTLVCLGVSKERLCGASCGDSAALLITEGQTYLLTERQVKNPPIGSSAAQPVAFTAALGRAWKVLVMSDGVWKYVGWERLEELARQLEGEALLTALRQTVASGWGGKLPDDFTLALLQHGTE
jgi:PPM family protein phosphatase